MIECRQSHPDDAKYLAATLSDLDRQEIAAYNPGANPVDNLTGGCTLSRDCKTLLVDDRPVAMWGVLDMVCDDTGAPFGAPWLLSAGAEFYTLAATRALLRETRASIDLWHHWYDRLEGFSWAEASDHHRLLRKLGFEFSPWTIEENESGDPLPPTLLFARVMSCINAGVPYYV